VWAPSSPPLFAAPPIPSRERHKRIPGEVGRRIRFHSAAAPTNLKPEEAAAQEAPESINRKRLERKEKRRKEKDSDRRTTGLGIKGQITTNERS